MTRRSIAFLLVALILPTAVAPVAARAVHAASKPGVFATNGLAIHGYDPVAYFTQKKPVSGKEAYSYRWKGATWRFVSAANRDAFKANPAKYAPQYGGYCAYAVSNGYTAPTEPTAWSIVEGKLYLNYSVGVRNRWNQNRSQRIKDGDRNWPGVLSK